MTEPGVSRSLPSRLLIAKQAAASQFLTTEPHIEFVAYAAHPSPQHNVVGVGVGLKIVKGKVTKRHSIRFYVVRKLAKQAIPPEFLLPARIQGVVTDVVETGRFRKFQTNPRARLRPARPGCSVGFQFTGANQNMVMAGTFGAVAGAGGGLYILSNNHVLANENSLPIGSTIFQPGLLDKNSPQADQIAKLTRFVELQANGANTVDCAIALVDDRKLVNPAVLPKVGRLRSGVPVAASEGMKVEKTGRTTNYTTGVIRDVSADVKITYDLGELTFTNQILVVGDKGSFSDAGDSGSLIVDRKTRRPVALLFAGSASHTLANHISDVVDALKVSIVA